jgi:hypothetical protein
MASQEIPVPSYVIIRQENYILFKCIFVVCNLNIYMKTTT